MATSPFDKTFANVHCALRNCVSSRLKMMGRGGEEGNGAYVEQMCLEEDCDMLS